jgi:GDP-L-fucose synthase
MNKSARIYVAGHTGMVGSAIVRKLQSEGYDNLLLKTRNELDLCRQVDVRNFFTQHKPEYVFLAAARVGGILANSSCRGQFIYENLMIQSNVIHAAHKSGVRKLLFLGSSCIYPKMSPQPVREEYLLSGELESSNEPYAVAKIAGVTMCQAYRHQYDSNFIACMPANLYGANDNFDLQTSHVLPALIRKFHEAKIAGAKNVTIWGTGKPRREFLHVDDLADACLFLMKTYDHGDIINVGTGSDIAISELAGMIQNIVGFKGELKYDPEKPDGTPRKLLDVSNINSIGWKNKIPLADGIRKTYQWYCDPHRN